MTNTLDNQNTPDEIDEILINMVEDTVMYLTNDLPSLLSQDYDFEVRRVHKDQILKNLPEAKAKIAALITAARIEELAEIPLHPNFITEYIQDRINTLTNDKIGGEHGDSK